MSILKSAAVAVIALSLGGAYASAGTVTWSFTGNITLSGTPEITVGEMYSGTLSYDTADSVFLTTTSTNFYTFGTTDMLSVSVGAFIFSITGPQTSNELLVSFNTPYPSGPDFDAFYAGPSYMADVSSNYPGLTQSTLSFQIAGPPGLLSSSSLPESFNPSDLGTVGYDRAAIGVIFIDQNGDFFEGDFSSLQIQTTPEPATGALLSSAFVVLIAWRKYLPGGRAREDAEV